MKSKKRSRLNDNCVEAVEEEIGYSTRSKKQRQYLGSDLFNQMLLDQLVIKIFSYFEYKDLLLAAALVCKRWEKLSWDSDLWQSLDLSRLPGRSDIPTRTVAKLVKRSKGIKHINLKDCWYIKDSVILNIVKQKELRTLILDGCRNISHTQIFSIANCRSLEHLNLSGVRLLDDALAMIAESCTKLIELDISHCFKITTKGLLPVIKHCTQLKCLNMYHCSKVEDDFLIALATEQSQIESLDISVCRFTDDGIQNLRKLPKLRGIHACLDNNLVSIFSNMTYLALHGDITNDGVSTIVRNNPNLEHLSLAWCELFDDNALEIISKSPCQFTLNHLNFKGCSTTEIGIIHILRNCAKLQSLTFSNVSGEIANKWTIDYPHIKFYGSFLK